MRRVLAAALVLSTVGPADRLRQGYGESAEALRAKAQAGHYTQLPQAGYYAQMPQAGRYTQTPPPRQPPPRCDAAEYRQFDFWVGDWEVKTPNGQTAGQNTITRELDNCVIKERWRGTGGMTGESFNIWDRTTKRWHQTWVSSTGALLLLDGEFRDGAMRMTGESIGPNGPVHNRITWTPNPDGTVRQFWETSADKGKTWTVAFDGLYRKK
jgi:hypothetical protein